MPDTVQLISYYSIPAVHKAGEAARVLGALADAKVDLTAFWGYPLKRKNAVLDIAPGDAKGFKAVMKNLGTDPGAKKNAFLVTGKNKTGTVAAALKKLAAAGINVHAAQAVSAGSSYGLMIQVADEDAKSAKKALSA